MDERRLLAKVSEMYYRDGLNQQQIAGEMNISRSMISRMLARAIEVGVVEIIIHYSDNRARDLEKRLQDKFGLMDCRVTTVVAVDSREEGRRYAAVHALADDYIQENLQDDTILSVSWGRALAHTVSSLRPKRKIPTLRVVQSFGSAMPNQDVDGATLVGGLATAFGGSAIHLHAPLHVGSGEMRDSLLRNQNIDPVLALAERTTIFLSGIGDTSPVPSGMAWMYYLTPEEEKDLEKKGKVGIVCAWHFDFDGNFIDSTSYSGLIGISHASYMKIPMRVGISYGDAKVEAIIGALRGGFVNVLVTDEQTAELVLARS